MKMLEIKDLRKSFNGPDVLKGVSINVNEGEVVVIIGSSGSGKSTLLRCAAQLEHADSGNITICGEELLRTDADGRPIYAEKKMARDIGKNIGLVFQNFNLFPHLSVLQNITEAPIHVYKTPKAEAEKTARELLEKLALSDKADAYPCELSGGQCQRVSIARALALSPKILLFDEPTSALDPELTGEILKVIRALAREHMTMVIVTHEMSFARDVGDHIIFMDNGSIIEEGGPEQVFGAAQHERTRAFLSNFTQTGL